MRSLLFHLFDLEPSSRRKPPYVTAAFLAACIAMFVAGLWTGAGTDGNAARTIGWAPAIDVWDGRQWTLLTSALLHFAVWHLAFNVYWIWRLGPVVEAELGAWRSAIFLLLAAYVSGAAQLATGETGIGASGVGYAIVGLLWVGRSRVPSFANAATDHVVILWMGWGGLCVVLTALGLFDVGNGAHAGGLAFGAAVAWAWTRRGAVATSAAAALCVAAAVVSVWCPWSHWWAGAQAVRAHRADDLAAAETWYERCIELGGDPAWPTSNLANIHLAQGHIETAERELEALRRMDAAMARDVESSAFWASRQAYSRHVRYDFAESARWYELALERGADPAWCWDSLASCRIAMGDLAEARECAERLRAIDAGKAAELDAYLASVSGPGKSDPAAPGTPPRDASPPDASRPDAGDTRSR